MKSTFHYRQDLKSSEFGTLLYDIIPSGIYKTPQLTVTNNHIVMTGGTFLLKDNTDNMNFIIRVSYEDNETLESLDTVPASVTTPYYIYLVFTYNPAMEVAPTLRVGASLPDSGTEYVFLGRLLSNNVIDTTTNDKRGGGYSYPNPIISSLTFTPVDKTQGTLDVVFNGYCQNNSTLSLINSFHQENVAISAGYALYIDQTGKPALMNYNPSSAYPSMGRTILAYKAPGATLFTVQNYVNRAEITADSLFLASASLTSNETVLDSIYTDSSTSNAQGAILSKVIQRLVVEVQALRDELNTLRSNHESLNSKVTNMSSSFTTGNLTVTGKATFTGANADFSNATVTFANSNFGTKSNPLSSLYVENVLYATSLQYFGA